MLKESDAYCVS